MEETAVLSPYMCPLCDARDLAMKGELLFCTFCNIFVSKPETFHTIIQPYIVDMQRKTYMADVMRVLHENGSFGIFPRKTVERWLLYIFLFLCGAAFVGVGIGMMMISLLRTTALF